MIRTLKPFRSLGSLVGRSRVDRAELLAGPLRGELLGAEQLADTAAALGRRQRLAEPGERPAGAPLLRRLEQSRGILQEAQDALAGAADRGVDVGPAGEWLLDNFHVVVEHVREVREAMPRDYYGELPKLANGPLTGYPRVYELATTLISHTEARLDLANLNGFVGAFQRSSPLSIGELWAIPAMLRLGLVESVRRMALRTVRRMEDIESADAWAERIVAANLEGDRAIGKTLDEFTRSPPTLTPVFVSRFAHQLRLLGGSSPPVAQIEQWIGDRSWAVEDATSKATQHLALTQVMMANSITSLRTVAHLDWSTFVEGQSALEAVLREDPSGFYAGMTFETRDRYRHVVERLARRTGGREEAVAREAVKLASQSLSENEAVAPVVRSHIGFYLVDDGLEELERRVGYVRSASENVHRWILRHPNAVFGGGILLGTAAALAALLALVGPQARSAWLLILIVAFIPALDLAISLVNQLVTAWLPPRALAKLDFRGQRGIPPEYRTAVVVPTLFETVDDVRGALENLEVQFLANRDVHVHFALLSDFADAEAQITESDEGILDAAIEGVRALNDQYATPAHDAFYLFHRPRRWNPTEGVWMGWERKRGKLAEFNRFLRGGTRDAFIAIVGETAPLPSVRYVITLDADTVLPSGAAADLVGALAHPLNRGIYDEASGRVVRGYGILQPRVGILLPSAHRSRFASIHSGHPGVDPYTTAVSDVYQDLFGEGSYTGKGIYDVDLFERATRGRFPENTLLSHDLVEGNYARAGLATEITVYDDYPTRYLGHARRKHRWIRGDWQLLRWLTPRVPGPGGPEPNRLSLLSRWKIADNLRRSTVELGQILFFFIGWALLPGSAATWTIFGLGAMAGPWVMALVLTALRPPRGHSWRAYYAGVGRDTLSSAQQVALAITFLPHQAWISADAIVRTLWRLFVTRRSLLEWQTASTAERSIVEAASGPWREMLPAVGTATAIGIGVTVPRLVASPAPFWWGFAAVVPLLILWGLSPLVARALSAPAVRPQRHLDADGRARATRLALLHWRYFDRFVGEETQWLVPDNFQEDPDPVVAMRTSPTNMGLQLMATVSASDLGFISVRDMADRLDLAFRSFGRMSRYRGHFYNWYELDELRVLEPAYVSTVDSGNLAGHLLAVRQACLTACAVPDPVGRSTVYSALDTGIAIAAERLRALPRSLGAEYRLNLAKLSKAGELLDAARQRLSANSGSAEPDLEEVTSILRVAATAFASVGAPAEARAPVEEWITWALERIAADAAVSSDTGLPARLNSLAEQARTWVMEMDFRFLFDEERELFSIGYQQSTHTLDRSYYDLLASESRLASFIAIVKGDVPAKHWFRLGRSVTRATGETALISWSGGMFEYLMPALVMRSIPFTLLEQTYRGVVRRQVSYGAERGVPWGVSESAYNLRDRHLTYQYRAFGVPDLALKRGLGRDLVIAPYASSLALLVDPVTAMANLAAIEKKGALGRYGFYDAIDYTRPRPGGSFAIVANYMAHHIGMSFASLANVLTDSLWQERFHADPMVRSAELLLHERIPRDFAFSKVREKPADDASPGVAAEAPAVREFTDPATAQPHIALLGTHPYTVMVSHCGSGYSHYENLAVTRWRADGTTDATGQFCYVRDITDDHMWSVAHQPTCVPAESYRAVLATDRVGFRRVDGWIETRTEIAVVPEDAAEVRYVSVTNLGPKPREVELTSYGEIVLGPADADRAHPAFANLFVETEWHEWCTAITATRRPRSATEIPLWCVHVVDSGSNRVGSVSCETDRGRFIGRGRSVKDPAALAVDGPLSGTTGAVLDPIFALRTRVRLRPGETASVAFTTFVATTRERAFELAGRYHDRYAAQRALDLAWTVQQVELRELDLSPADAAAFQELAGYLIFPRPELRAAPSVLLADQGSRSLLWETGISGDWPIVLATLDSITGLATLRQLFAAHHYWRRRGMTVDVVVLIEEGPSYLQDLQARILDAMYASNDAEMDRTGGVFIRRHDQLTAESLRMIEATARLRVRCEGHPLTGSIVSSGVPDETPAEAPEAVEPPYRRAERPSQAGSAGSTGTEPSSLADSAEASPSEPGQASATSPRTTPVGDDGEGAGALQFDNGYGGLDPSGAYRIRVRGSHLPPAPWSNVIANPHGGFVVTERGAGFVWAENSYFFRLTPWHNDPIGDPISEILYLRDEETGEVWSATPAPVGGDSEYLVAHRQGASVFESVHHGIATRLAMGMADGEALKLSRLELTNHGPTPRRISVTAYVEWTLGVQREHTRHHVRTEYDRESGAILARNPFDPTFAGKLVFCALSLPIGGFTADRHEFLGRNGSVANPAALRTDRLAGRTGAGLDPCAALRCSIDLAPGETREVVMMLGASTDREEARATISRYGSSGSAAGAISNAEAAWAFRLSAVSVRTPDPAFDAMINWWTLYQALSCRFWGRSAVYQSSGAYGFRDQLQDVLAFLYAEPGLARNHILVAAARQFEEGDVQHWWHPQGGQGVRTRFSDDLVWLPYAVDRYVQVTGDETLLHETAPFLTGPPLGPDEHEVYGQPTVTATHASIYEHCVRALRRASTIGPHGLPLIGSGDWNDGMNRVGIEGRGESVWLAWFLTTTLRAFAHHARARGDTAVVEEFEMLANGYADAANSAGWDGAWYRRAYFDDGTPLGSSANDECRIDSIAQSWSVISRAGSEPKQALAMQSLADHLVRPDLRLIALLSPPFDEGAKDPGYIKGYVPGVRENGAQYTHAALWAVLAAALRGNGDQAFEWFQMLNPLMHARTPDDVGTYKVEPYVVAADVYTAEGQAGRGGWTWYTGAASWTYRVGLEAILGFTKTGNMLRIDPRVPSSWKEYRIEYRHGSALYRITVREPGKVQARGASILLDGRPLEAGAIPLEDDGTRHEVLVTAAHA